jgi:hypothetical protein
VSIAAPNSVLAADERISQKIHAAHEHDHNQGKSDRAAHDAGTMTADPGHTGFGGLGKFVALQGVASLCVH